MPDASVTALRGTIVSFTGDALLIDPAKAFVHEPDGLIVCRNGKIEAAGPYDSVRASLPCERSRHRLFRLHYLGRLRRHPCALCADRDDRFSGQAAAAMGQGLHLSPPREAFADEAHAARSGSVFCDDADRATARPRRHLLRGLSAIGGRLVRGGLQAQPASRSPANADGPQRARSSARYAHSRLRPLQGADREMAWKGEAAFTPSRRASAGSSTPAQLEAAGALRREIPI